MRIYTRNIQLQLKLDGIRANGTGNYGLDQTVRTFDRSTCPHLVPELKSALKKKQ